MGLYVFSLSLDRYEAIDFAGTMVGDTYGLLVRYPNATTSFWTVYKPYDSKVFEP